MATVVNNADSGEGRVWGPLIVVLVIVLAAIAFFVWGLPAMNGNAGGTTVNIPDQVDVNVGGAADAMGDAVDGQ